MILYRSYQNVKLLFPLPHDNSITWNEAWGVPWGQSDSRLASLLMLSMSLTGVCPVVTPPPELVPGVWLGVNATCPSLVLNGVVRTVLGVASEACAGVMLEKSPPSLCRGVLIPPCNNKMYCSYLLFLVPTLRGVSVFWSAMMFWASWRILSWAAIGVLGVLIAAPRSELILGIDNW